MSELAAEIAALIAAEGPLPLDRYMALALGHPRHGYYVTRDPLGAAGDFTTAPEISQVFGELLGLWAAEAWRLMGAPRELRLVELGPGRGTLMADLLRAARAVPAFHAALDIHLVETSPVLAEAQRARLGQAGRPLSWHAGLASVPEGPLVLIANEFLDALPVRQFVMTARGWRERVVGLGGGRLAFGLAPDPVPPSVLPEALRRGPEGAVAEIRPAASALAAELAGRGRRHPLAALFVDYGHAAQGHGDTLQAMRGHRFADPLEAPGEQDLTAHVDFAALAAAAAAHGLAAGPVVTQRRLLFALGLAERAEALARANPAAFPAIAAAVERLVDPAPAGMGSLFKAVAMSNVAAVNEMFT